MGCKPSPWRPHEIFIFVSSFFKNKFSHAFQVSSIEGWEEASETHYPGGPGGPKILAEDFG